MASNTNIFASLIRNTKDVYTTNEGKYNTVIRLVNQAGNFCKLDQSLIKSLSITDNFTNPFLECTLNVDNENNQLEMSKSPEYISKGMLNSFIPLNNGSDLVYIYFSEYNENPGDNINYDLINLVGIFSICDVKDIFIDDKKIKSYKLVDYNEQILKTTFGEFSTAAYAYKISNQPNFKFSTINEFDTKKQFVSNDYIKISNLTNEERSLPTGTSIALLLKQIFGDECYIDYNNFDFGGPSVFYSAAPNESNLESLYKLLSLHNARSVDKDTCYLNYYYSVSKEKFIWSFTSISDEYKNFYNTKIGAISQFNLQLNGLDMSSKTQKTLDNTIPKSFHFGGATSNVSKFFFSDLTTDENLDNIKTKVIYNFNPVEKSFTIDNTSSSYANTLKAFKENYTDPVIKRYPNTPISIYQTNNLNAEHIINYYNSDTNISIGRNKTLKDLIRLNNILEFTTAGNIIMRAGYFVTINYDKADKDNQYLIKLLGEGMITRIVHTFADGNYTTKLQISKPMFLNKPFFYKENYTING